MPMKRMKRPPLHDPPPQPERQQVPVAEEGAAKIRKGRGPSKGRKIALEANRPKLTVIGDMEFEAVPDDGKVNQVKTTIRQIVLARLDQPYLTYLHFPKTLMEGCLKDFLMCYRWADQQDEDRCRQVFNNIANDRFTDSLGKARKDCLDKFDRDMEKWKTLQPDWCKDSNLWAQLCDEWAKKEWQDVSIQNSENRRSGDNIFHHVAGSASAYRHAKKLEIELGKKPTYEDVFVRTKVLPPDENGERHFVDAKSQQVYESYLDKRIERRGDDPSTYPPNAVSEDLDLFLEVSGGYSHGKFYGIDKIINTEVIPENPRKRKRAHRDMPVPPISSTATTSGEKELYTKAEVCELLAQHNSKQMYYVNALYDHLGLVLPAMPPSDGPEVDLAQHANGTDDGNEFGHN